MAATPLTLIEKLATRFAEGRSPQNPVRSGDFVTIRPRHVMTHDNTGAVIPKFREIFKAAGLPAQVHDPRQPVFAIDHDIQNVTPENLGKYAKIEAFANEHGIDFYPPGTGISHQVMVEQGYVRPGTMVVGSDSHSNLYGALCCLGTPVVRTDAASLWATGVTWWQAPPVAKVVLTGTLRPGVVGKDVIVALCGLFNKDEVLNHAVEFTGDGVSCLSIDQRMSIANMSTEWGSLAGVFPFDRFLRDYLFARAAYFAAGHRPGTRRPGSLGTYTAADVESWWSARSELEADPGAPYAVELELDLSSVVPHVSGPNDVKTMTSLPMMQSRHVKIHKAWLMSCVNARLEDIAAAAAVVRGRKVAPGVEFYLAAASSDVQQAATERGDWQALLDAGAIELPPGCGTCIGLGRGTIKAGEVGISATNRNFEGRMGDKNGQVYLGSPAVVAASAIAGYITAPTAFESAQPRGTVRSRRTAATPPAGPVQVLDGFPAVVTGRLWFLDRDNLNTDGIYAGKHTYNDAMTPSQMAEVIFENYDPALRSQLAAGDVIAGGLNFGTGSSREQAATALKFAGIPCVIAASFSETYKRNAFNNGFVVFECPALVEHVRGAVQSPAGQTGAADPSARRKSVLAGTITIDYRSSTLTLTPPAGPPVSCAFPPLSPVAQELVVAGGAEAVVQRRLAQQAR
ncbi:MAG: 3-isopropylmalate dehydratase large subunit [Phycisphaerales bacterium]|nr:3-isopropylmalate dehydratase large subunit [Phycisphaerales bacterium]